MILKRHFLKVLPLVLASSILSCAHSTPKVIETPSFKKWVSGSDVPKVIAVLPFTNETEVEGLNQLLRESFYEYFSVRSFHDVEIKEIDTTIEILEETEGKDFHKIQPKNWESFCDAMPWFMEKLKGLKGFFSLSMPKR